MEATCILGQSLKFLTKGPGNRPALKEKTYLDHGGSFCWNVQCTHFFTHREVEQRVDIRQSQPRHHQFLKVGMRMIKEAFLPHIRHDLKQKKNKFYSRKIAIQP